jgi:hypothetical protein
LTVTRLPSRSTKKPVRYPCVGKAIPIIVSLFLSFSWPYCGWSCFKDWKAIVCRVGTWSLRQHLWRYSTSIKGTTRCNVLFIHYLNSAVGYWRCVWRYLHPSRYQHTSFGQGS